MTKPVVKSMGLDLVAEFKSKLGFKWSSLNLSAGDYEGLEKWLEKNLHAMSWHDDQNWMLLKSVTDTYFKGTNQGRWKTFNLTNGDVLTILSESINANSKSDYFGCFYLLLDKSPFGGKQEISTTPGKVTIGGIVDGSLKHAISNPVKVTPTISK